MYLLFVTYKLLVFIGEQNNWVGSSDVFFIVDPKPICKPRAEKTLQDLAQILVRLGTAEWDPGCVGGILFVCHLTLTREHRLWW